MNLLEKWLPAVFMMAFIFLMSSMPGTTVNQLGLGGSRIQLNGHLVMYFMLCILYFKATKNIILAVLLTILYGMADEFHQQFVLWRSPSLFDIKVDALGALLAGIILWKLQPILPKKLRDWLNG